jgi:hypothetical protein
VLKESGESELENSRVVRCSSKKGEKCLRHRPCDDIGAQLGEIEATVASPSQFTGNLHARWPGVPSSRHWVRIGRFCICAKGMTSARMVKQSPRVPPKW